jgi:sugar phosphate isomerase/epimerase
MKTVISAHHFAWRDAPDAIDTASQQLGLDGVEFSWHESLRPPNCSREDLDWLAARPRSDGLQLSAHIWDNVAEPDPDRAADSLTRWLELATRTGVGNLVVHGGSYHDQREGIVRTRRVFERVLPAYERAGLVLNLENHYAYGYRNCRELFSEPWEFLEVLTLNSHSLRFCFDTGHGNMTRNTEALLDTLAPWLNYVHLADNRGVDDDHLAYGLGTVDWDGVFLRLAAHGYDRVLCVEFPVRDDVAPFRACVDAIRHRWARQSGLRHQGLRSQGSGHARDS